VKEETVKIVVVWGFLVEYSMALQNWQCFLFMSLRFLCSMKSTILEVLIMNLIER
jgi:hypothetical protein